MGNDAGYKRGQFKKVDTSKMTMDDAFAYIEFLMEEQRLIEEIKKARNASDKTDTSDKAKEEAEIKGGLERTKP